ncbi:MAG: cupin domain-containing protein [Elusimicrobiota bacterium]|nr:cupin domain-containing protein [Elusimicrobiota bacterium]
MRKENENEKEKKEVLLAKPLKLVNLISYQKNSVVSHTLINKKTGTVTLFAFDNGQGLSEHTAPFDAMVYILDGEAKITISGNPLSAKKGEMVIMPANKPHSLKAEKKFKMLLVMIKD